MYAKLSVASLSVQVHKSLNNIDCLLSLSDVVLRTFWSSPRVLALGLSLRLRLTFGDRIESIV